ncbi:Fatty acid desaturase [Friedmanniella luteola]|uniref:Fatty acid desaturase n=1 Tax=Friedmanniella luteola TaxID=546871 RepID=A0A1H1PLV4_9ACTN|nr:acyl-CoA desaturase [Friedmanniella luteola]SDS12067.1 Fatty acid desaturase [Friedmanniella luteola]
MTTLPAANAGPRSRDRAASRYVSDFTELTRRVQAAGLMGRTYGFYWTCLAAAAVALGSLVAGMVLLGDTWLQLLLAGALGIVMAQLGFLGHEASHRQIFRSARWNDWTGRVLSGLLVGISYGWWMRKHTRHHAAPNQLDKDPDIVSGVVAFSAEAAAARGPLGEWLARRQGWFYLPLLALEGLSLHVSSVRHLLDPSPVRHRWVEILFVGVRLVGYPVAVFLLLPPGMALAFIGVQVGVFGFLLGGAFTPNHVAMPILDRGVKVDFLRRQVLMSRNIAGGPFVHFLMGGLAHQVEHHLFPGMARPNLRRAAVLVRAHCREHGIVYTETTLVEAYRHVLGYLNEVGLEGRAETFSCPLTQAYRV